MTGLLQKLSARREGRRLVVGIAVAAAMLHGRAAVVVAQGIDCGQLQAQIAAAGAADGGAGRYVAAAQRQRAEVDRTVAYARSLGCDRQQFLFFGSAPPPQCGQLNARIAQMQGNLAQLQASAGGGRRQQLIASYNAYCRGGAVAQRPRGFFEQLFGGAADPAPQTQDGSDGSRPQVADDGETPRGGSQAVCVRTCDGGFFPINYSPRRDSESLTEMCHALCPNVETSVFTRAPSREIQSAVSLNGTPYADLPNALKFQKTFDAACTCRPAGQSWAQVLVNADAMLGTERRGDIIVTPEKSAELSRPKLDPRTLAATRRVAGDVKVAPRPAADDASEADAAAAAQVPTASRESAGIAPGTATNVPYSVGTVEKIDGPDGLKRSVRKVGPQL